MEQMKATTSATKAAEQVKELSAHKQQMVTERESDPVYQLDQVKRQIRAIEEEEPKTRIRILELRNAPTRPIQDTPKMIEGIRTAIRELADLETGLVILLAPLHELYKLEVELLRKARLQELGDQVEHFERISSKYERMTKAIDGEIQELIAHTQLEINKNAH